MIVVEPEVIAYLLIAGEKTPLAQQTFQKDADWVLPPIWQHEFLNLLASFVQQKGCTLEQAEQLWKESQRLFAGRKQRVRREQALRLACEQQITVYEAMYLSLAIDLGILLISERPTLQRQFPTLVKSMQRFCLE